jgi:hypothetical protein
MSGAYGASAVRRTRRTKAQLSNIRDGLYEIVMAEQPMTVRGAYYQAMVHGLVPKHDSGYRTVQRLLLAMRRDETIPYGWIADNTRWVRQPETFDSIEQAIRETQRIYRHNLWTNADTRLEVWCEKDALAGVLVDVTYPACVPLYVCRGFSSETYAYEAAQVIRQRMIPTYVAYFGDYDGAGLTAANTLRRKLTEFVDGEVEVHFESVAVTRAQVAEWDLPTQAPEKKADRRLGLTFCAELDAVPARQLRGLVQEQIARHLTPATISRVQAIEQDERDLFEKVARYARRLRVVA